MTYYVDWARNIVNGNLFEIYHASPSANFQKPDSLTVPYTPLSQYFIAGIAWVLLLVLPTERETFVTAVNLTCVIFTFLTTYLLYKNRKKLSLKFARLYLLTPAVFLISPVLAYEDSIMAFFLTYALIALKRSNYTFAGSLFACSIFSKQLALIPTAGVILLLLLSLQARALLRITLGFFATMTAILSPFIFSGTLLLYFKSQSLTSIHTMLSAQAPNFPWLASLLIRITEFGFVDGLEVGGNSLRITNDSIRQLTYLASGAATILIFLAWVLFWRKRMHLSEIDFVFAAAIMIFSYHLFNYGVHENHIFMIFPILFLLSYYPNWESIYWPIAANFSVVLIISSGLGKDSFYFPGVVSTNPGIYTSLTFLNFLLYLFIFVKLFLTKPSIHGFRTPIRTLESQSDRLAR